MAGGLGQYLGVDSTVLRIGFVIASLVFLGGFGGPVLYLIAWIVMPQESQYDAINRPASPGRPWQDWDRSARSWVLVLGAAALALVWSFGVWPWWHWGTLPFWLVGLAVVLWVLARRRDCNPAGGQQAPWNGPAGPGPGPGTPPGGAPGYGPGPNGAPQYGPGPAPDAGPQYGPGPAAAPNASPGYGPLDDPTGVPDAETGEVATDEPGAGERVAPAPATPAGASNASAPGGPPSPAVVGPSLRGVLAGSDTPSTTPGTTLGSAFGGARPKPGDPSEADWAEAQSAAADWAAGQLELAGVPAKPDGSANMAGSYTSTAARRSLPMFAVRSMLRGGVRLFVALLTAVVLLAVIAVVAVTLGTGSSLRGGVGDRTFNPTNLAAVQPAYRVGAGNLDLNLSRVRFPASGKTVQVSVGLGNLTVQVPKGTVVMVQARSGIGQVTVFGQSGSRVQTTFFSGPSPAAGAPHLDLKTHVGIGDLQVMQG